MAPLPQQTSLPAVLAPAVQPAPAYNPIIQGLQDLKLDPAQTSRIQNFLSTYSTPKRLSGVFVVPDDKWDATTKAFNVPWHGARVAFAMPAAGRVYVNANLLNNKNWGDGVEWALAHELAHINDSRPPLQQELADRQIDDGARKALANWAKQYWNKK